VPLEGRWGAGGPPFPPLIAHTLIQAPYFPPPQKGTSSRDEFWASSRQKPAEGQVKAGLPAPTQATQGRGTSQQPPQSHTQGWAIPPRRWIPSLFPTQPFLAFFFPTLKACVFSLSQSKLHLTPRKNISHETQPLNQQMHPTRMLPPPAPASRCYSLCPATLRAPKLELKWFLHPARAAKAAAEATAVTAGWGLHSLALQLQVPGPSLVPAVAG